jgi:hypothetical protein
MLPEQRADASEIVFGIDARRRRAGRDLDDDAMASPDRSSRLERLDRAPRVSETSAGSSRDTRTDHNAGTAEGGGIARSPPANASRATESCAAEVQRVVASIERDLDDIRIERSCGSVIRWHAVAIAASEFGEQARDALHQRRSSSGSSPWTFRRSVVRELAAASGRRSVPVAWLAHVMTRSNPRAMTASRIRASSVATTRRAPLARACSATLTIIGRPPMSPSPAASTMRSGRE